MKLRSTQLFYLAIFFRLFVDRYRADSYRWQCPAVDHSSGATCLHGARIYITAKSAFQSTAAASYRAASCELRCPLSAAWTTRWRNVRWEIEIKPPFWFYDLTATFLYLFPRSCMSSWPGACACFLALPRTDIGTAVTDDPDSDSDSEMPALKCPYEVLELPVEAPRGAQWSRALCSVLSSVILGSLSFFFSPEVFESLVMKYPEYTGRHLFLWLRDTKYVSDTWHWTWWYDWLAHCVCEESRVISNVRNSSRILWFA